MASDHRGNPVNAGKRTLDRYRHLAGALARQTQRGAYAEIKRSRSTVLSGQDPLTAIRPEEGYLEDAEQTINGHIERMYSYNLNADVMYRTGERMPNFMMSAFRDRHIPKLK